MTSGHQIMTGAAISSPVVAYFSSSQPPSFCPRGELVGFEQHLWPGQHLRPASLTVSTTVVSANAIVYDSRLDLMPGGSPSRVIFDQRSPALWRGVAAFGICPGEAHHPTRGLGPSGVKVRQVQSARGTKDYPCRRQHACAARWR
jgi:hypothetical protein